MYTMNFCAGPAQLKSHIYQSLIQMIHDYKGTKLSLLSLSHRDELFAEVNHNIKQYLTQLLNLSNDYEILLMSGGASGQFAAIPMNLNKSGKALYINSGYWSQAAIKEAKKFIAVDLLSMTESSDLIASQYDYVHYTENETIDGIQWHYIPNTSSPLVCDMSSSFLSKPTDISRYDLVYAGAQKNIGLPGITVVIIKKSLIDEDKQSIPAILNYATMQQTNSLYNTPDVIAWVSVELVLQDLLAQGGLAIVAENNNHKARLLYKAIDDSKIFNNFIAAEIRSKMNVVFHLPSLDQTTAFLNFAREKGVYGIAGHRSTGGVRVSLYNSITLDEVKAFITVMQEFEYHGK
ncbi:3-phosphoserine/phosphohydroxythreonine transaminase [Fastidiosibacter lacustris]|uniref:3-phosphoserine/phosphohydroxythreonine transaminase n=1 Tax=Fastidiosibacter lacustris TaxID=2056695 RepID=UPI001EFD3A09|nr:3-phosphoserine/phosphohydroxythreonine transaminase [Fastidiosibacter lacustris]